MIAQGKVSVIMPIYNSEKYLHRAIQSVLDQIYSNIELILVDDGSNDDSGVICDEFAKKDDRVKVVHKENEGVSIARNQGLNSMTGEFCMFIDSDDVIPLEYIITLVEKMTEEKCDVVFCGVTRVKGSERREFLLEDDVLLRDQYLYELYLAKKFVTKSSCIGLYKSEIINHKNVRFPENVVCGEDSLFVLKYISHVSKIGTVKGITYNYMYDNLSSATSYIYYDHYLVEMQRYDITNQLVEDSTIKKQIAQMYMNSEIRELIQYAMYSEEEIVEKIMALKKFVINKNTRYAIKNYVRDSKEKSFWIPVAIRGGLGSLLYLFVTDRSKKISKKEGFVKSAYR